ncbi:MAG: Methionine aminopeptidase [Candidatus Curtissbacteria bacterium GW2011_GWA1_40_16]|uniref:Methionine aminopeptidase n=1 Tax=Candidatus Curtissbacteria bacterium GW2011_GWA1_40_16 TaxID=1618405 RepID=A0A0G0UHC6_9BACT|nr:MAG: Methionine aminopeptidase [Candidatus Curtissbacteria bacterium GW2011_GWA1_40_16]
MKSNWIKSEKEVELMKKSGQIAAYALKKVRENIKPGISCKFLDDIAQREIEKLGATPSFMTVENYQYTICTTINEQVVHGIPTDRILKSGDIIGIDIGALYKGFHSDLAITVPVGDVSSDIRNFLSCGENALKKAIKKAMPGNKIGDVSSSIQGSVETAGYSIVKELTGHGVGKMLHEEPFIPGFGKPHSGPVIAENMTIAIEVIYTNGSGEIGLEKDNWTITTADGSLGGLFEQTVLTSKSGPVVLTPYM